MKKELGKHGFSGSVTPGESDYSHYWTFSVGCFQWLVKSGGGLKKGKVKVRVKGLSKNPELVYAEATRICELLDKSTYQGPKTVKVGIP